MSRDEAWPGVSLEGVPEPLVRRLEARVSPGNLDLESPESLSRALARAAHRQLNETEPGAARDPSAAMDLLAADALLTAACRVALATDRPAHTLIAILDTAVGRTEEESS